MDVFFYIGWLGSISYIIAYFLLVRGIISAEKKTYHLLNMLGGICLIINAAGLKDFPNIVVNAMWAVMASYMILKLSNKKKKNNLQQGENTSS